MKKDSILVQEDMQPVLPMTAKFLQEKAHTVKHGL